MAEFKELQSNELWREVPKVLFFIAHPDDERLWASEAIGKLRRSGVYTRVLRATRGDKGKLWGSEYPPEKVMMVRDKEYRRSTRAMGVWGDTLKPAFHDTKLTRYQTDLNSALLAYVQVWGFGGVVGMAPTERYTPEIAHADHIATGIAIEGLQYADMGPRAMSFRPAITYWTSNENAASKKQMRQLTLTNYQRTIRLRSFFKHYPSQFSGNIRQWWRGILDDISLDPKTGQHRQLFIRVR